MHAPSLALHDGGKVGLQTAAQPLKHRLLLPIFPLCMQGGWSTWSCSSPTREALPCSPPAHPYCQRMEGKLIGCNGIRNLICSDQNENLINSNVKVGKKKRCSVASSASLVQKGRRMVIRAAARDSYLQVLRQVLIKVMHRGAVSAVVLGCSRVVPWDCCAAKHGESTQHAHVVKRSLNKCVPWEKKITLKTYLSDNHQIASQRAVMFYVVENMNVKIDPKYSFCTARRHSSQRAIALCVSRWVMHIWKLPLFVQPCGRDGWGGTELMLQGEHCYAFEPCSSTAGLHVAPHPCMCLCTKSGGQSSYPAGLARIAVQLVTRS